MLTCRGQVQELSWPAFRSGGRVLEGERGREQDVQTILVFRPLLRSISFGGTGERGSGSPSMTAGHHEAPWESAGRGQDIGQKACKSHCCCHGLRLDAAG